MARLGKHVEGDCLYDTIALSHGLFQIPGEGRRITGYIQNGAGTGSADPFHSIVTYSATGGIQNHKIGTVTAEGTNLAGRDFPDRPEGVHFFEKKLSPLRSFFVGPLCLFQGSPVGIVTRHMSPGFSQGQGKVSVTTVEVQNPAARQPPIPRVLPIPRALLIPGASSGDLEDFFPYQEIYPLVHLVEADHIFNRG